MEEKGPNLPFPYSSKITTSKHSGMRELRIQHQGRPLRVLYIFDPRRMALLLLRSTMSFWRKSNERDKSGAEDTEI